MKQCGQTMEILSVTNKWPYMHDKLKKSRKDIRPSYEEMSSGILPNI